MTQQTAVEWLLNNLLINGLLRLTKDEHKLYKELKEQAKQMEKVQIIEAYDAGLFDGTMDDVNDRIYKQYYNETYNK